MKYLSALVVFAVVMAACGSDGDSARETAAPTAPVTTGTAAAPEPTAAPATAPLQTTPSTTSGGPSTTATTDGSPSPSTTAAPVTTTTARPRPEGEDAPDFTLQLGQGGTFTLSQEQKPVYMVFWAEW